MDNNAILVIGDVSFDVFLVPNPLDTFCRKMREDNYICFTYGDKIPVDSLSYYPGGCAANVAIGMKRMGIDSSLLTTFGDDSLSRLVRKQFDEEHVDTSLSSIDPQALSNYATIISYNEERTIFSYHAPKSYIFPESMQDFAFIYLTSMGEGFESFYQSAVKWIKEHPLTQLCFNPGSVQLHSDPTIIKTIFSSASYVFINRKEAEYYTGITNSQGRENDLIHTLRSYGVKTIIITDGDKGSYICHESVLYKASCFPTTVVEKTGAGDAYNSGFLAAVMKGYPVTDAILLAAANSSSVIQKVGAQKNLLREKDIDSILRKVRQDVALERIPL